MASKTQKKKSYGTRKPLSSIEPVKSYARATFEPVKAERKRVKPDDSPDCARLTFAPEVAKHIDLLVEMCPVEIMWFGHVVYDKALRLFHVDRIFVPPNQVASTSSIREADITNANIMSSVMDWAQRENLDWFNVSYWGHSHVNGGTQLSPTDWENIGRWISGHRDNFLITTVHARGKKVSADMFVHHSSFLSGIVTRAGISIIDSNGFTDADVDKAVSEIESSVVRAVTYAHAPRRSHDLFTEAWD